MTTMYYFFSYFRIKEIEIDKRIPRDVNGIAVFNPFWFTDGSKTPKQESTEVELHEGMKWNYDILKPLHFILIITL